MNFGHFYLISRPEEPHVRFPQTPRKQMPLKRHSSTQQFTLLTFSLSKKMREPAAIKVLSILQSYDTLAP